LKITFLAPHIRIAGGVRAILTYADRLAGRGHDVTVVVPAKRPWRAWSRNLRGIGPEWIPGFRARVRWASRWDPARLPKADAIVATAWQSAEAVARAPSTAGAKFYFVQHYESLYHGEPERVDATYALPPRKIVISTWLKDIMRDRFGSVAELLVTPVDRALFHQVEGARSSDALRVLMLHHDYAWKGVREGLEAIAAVKVRHPEVRLVGFGVKKPREALPYDEFLENLPQDLLAMLYSRCPVYLCPSWDEGLGMPPLGRSRWRRRGRRWCRRPPWAWATASCRLRRRWRSPVQSPVSRARLMWTFQDTRPHSRRLSEARRFDWDRATARLEDIIRAAG
jgi:glycosyltransferase involved in cell wall biosynthesis